MSEVKKKKIFGHFRITIDIITFDKYCRYTELLDCLNTYQGIFKDELEIKVTKTITLKKSEEVKPCVPEENSLI